jgi:glycosyltransferase involved in cell wall biosynthesis
VYSTAPYASVRSGEWQRVGNASVFYAPPERLRARELRQLIESTPHDVLYLNRLLSPTMAAPVLFFRALGKLTRKPLIIAPRGELSRGALATRAAKKRLYLLGARVAGAEDALWQASSEFEAEEIRAHFRLPSRNIVVAPDLSPEPDAPAPPHEPKQPGALRAMFLSRIVPKKNLELALDALARLGAPARFDIYGPIRDESYWRACQRRIERMPAGVTVTYHGGVSHRDAARLFARHDVLLFPTRGENFGHAILEALAGGCPVITSDQTAFRGLENAGVGWDISLDRPDEFVARLGEVREMDEPAHRRLREAAIAYAAARRADPIPVEQNRARFARALEAGR